MTRQEPNTNNQSALALTAKSNTSDQPVLALIAKAIGDESKAKLIVNKLSGPLWGVSSLRDLFELTAEDLLEACPQLLSRVTTRRIMRLCKEQENLLDDF